MSQYNFSFVKSALLSATLKESKIQRLLEKNLSFTQLDNAYILPNKTCLVGSMCKILGGVVSAQGDYIMSSAWHEGVRCDKYYFDKNNVTFIDETVIYMGIMSTCWGHAITDNLKKLWFLKTDLCQDLCRKGAKLIYLTIDSVPMPQYIQDLFALTSNNLCNMKQITEISQFKTIVIPDNSFIADRGERYYTLDYLETIQFIKNKVRELQSSDNRYSLHDKVYFTRTGIHSDRDMGEKNIEHIFKKMGYAIISPEKISIAEQLSILQHCNYFAATEGSVSHNALFCKPGTLVTIVRKADDVNKYQMAINAAADVNATYVDAHYSVRNNATEPWCGPFYLFRTHQMVEYAKKVGNVHLFYYPAWMLPSFWGYQIWFTDYFNKYVRNRKIIKKWVKKYF